MISNEQLLAELKRKLDSGEVSAESVRHTLYSTSTSQIEREGQTVPGADTGLGSMFHNISAAKVLYIVGGIIALLGIGTFVLQIWSSIGSPMRIFITLGFGLILIGVARELNDKITTTLGNLFHFGGGILVMAGILVSFYEILPDHHLLEWFIGISFLLLMATYAVFYRQSKQAVFTFFIILSSLFAQGYIITALGNSLSFASISFYILLSIWFLLCAFLYSSFLQLLAKQIVWVFLAIANATIASYAALTAVLTALAIAEPSNALYYLAICIGVSYLALGFRFEDTFARPLQSLLYFFGSFAVLYNGFQLLGGSVVWEILYAPLVLGMLAVSTVLRSRLVLVISTLAIVAYVTYITDKYFADSLGWPISLILLGLTCVGLGYTSLAINKRYITK